MIKAILFDFDGTLSNRKRNAYELFNEYFRQYFPDFDDMEYEAMLQDFLTMDCNGTINVKYRIAPFIDKYGKNGRFEEDFFQKYKTFYYDNMWKTTFLKDEVISVLEKLQGHFKLGILSNGQSKSQHDKISHVQIDKYFDDIIVSEDIGVNKPDKRAFEIAANRLGVKCSECLFIGDVFSSDILGAIRAGMVPVWITTDFERPSYYYDGYRITKLTGLFKILNLENSGNK